MKKTKSALTTIIKIIALILGVLFFAFVFTYDFSNKKSLKNDITISSVSNEFDLLFDEALQKSNLLNTLEINVTEDFLNNFMIYFLNSLSDDNEVIYETDYWVLNDIYVELKPEKMIMNIHITFKKYMNYKIKIQALFDFDEYDDSYLLTLKSLKVGNLFITENSLKRTINGTGSGSIGDIFKNVANLIFVGSYDTDGLKYKIYKKELIDNLESGILSDIVFKNDNEKTLLKPILNVLIAYNLVSVDITNNYLEIKIEYSKLINKDETVKNIKNIKENLNTDDFSLKYSYYLEDLLNKEEIFIDRDILNNRIINNVTKRIDINENDLIYLYGIDTKILNNELRLSLVLCFNSRKLLLDYFFINLNDMFVLDRIELGRDNNEKEVSYIVVNDSEYKISFLKLLAKLSINVDTINESINVKNILNIKNLNTSTLRTNSEQIIYSLVVKEIDIKNELLSEDLNNFIAISGINYENEEKLIESFNKLEESDKIFYFKKIKEYYKDTISVYNYICSLIN